MQHSVKGPTPNSAAGGFGEDIRKHESDKPYAGNESGFQGCLWNEEN